jgi:tellurite resistance protein TehA-like permease
MEPVETRLIAKLKSGIEELSPASFAMVMATGIVSIASRLIGFQAIATTLFWLNLILFICLLLLTAGRIIHFPRRFFSNMSDHAAGVGYLTLVAATDIVGIQFIIFRNGVGTALVLFVCSIVLWLILMYAVFAALIAGAEKPDLRGGINGIWLISTVSTESISILGSMLVNAFPDHREPLLFFSLLMFLMGCMLYLLIIPLLFYRILFFRLTPEEFSGPYWINMGAAAAATLAGAEIVMNSPGSAFLTGILPFTTGFTLSFWAIATWWIPLLLVLDAWRYFSRGRTLFHDPGDWGMVFPIGMYTACTYQLSQAAGIEFLLDIPRISIYAALTAWTLTFLGSLRSIKRLF